MTCSRRLRRRDEAGYVALLTAILFSSVFLGLAAIGVDTARWYVEIERIQKAADAAALAGVVYMPGDFAKATIAADSTAASNGYSPSSQVTVKVEPGMLPSQLRVTISSRIPNSFGSFLGISNTTLTRTSVSDYTAPAPMGSPCNTFGNEPPSTTGSAQPTGTAQPSPAFPNCKTDPQFWAAVEGPATGKVQGDRYGTTSCDDSVYKCSGGKNTEYREDGYFFAIHVEPPAVNKQIDVQLYDPAFVQTGKSCGSIPTTFSGINYLINRMSSYTPTDGQARYKNTSSIYCSGDYLGTSIAAPTTTFVLREQTDTGDPMKGAVINPSQCTKQFGGTTTTPGAALREWRTETGNEPYSGYNPDLTRVFHQWISLCTFTPQRAGDYYLQVRTNVPAGGNAVVNRNASNQDFPTMRWEGNPRAGDLDAGTLTTGSGVNAFAMRAVPADSSLRSQVAVAGYSRMPILQNVTGSTAVFNLIRALPSTRGQYISFSFYDVSDCGSGCSGSVRIVRPTDATGSIRDVANIAGCRTSVDPATLADASNCTAQVSNAANNGKLQTMVIPIPNDYGCDPSTLGGCWFSVTVTFNNGADVSDITTWDANIDGDPVRLVE